MNIAVIVPFYNEEINLVYFIKEWENFLTKNKFFYRKLYFFFIDDGSTDDSIRAINKNIRHLKFKIIKKKNSGHGDSCKFAYNLIVNKYKKYDYLLQIDSDNQCDPKYIIHFYNLIKKNKKNKFVFGYRHIRQDGIIRSLSSKIMAFSFFIKKFLYIKDLNTPYRMMGAIELKIILDDIIKIQSHKDIELFNCVLSYFISKKYQINWININFRNRYYGNSKFSSIKMLRMFIKFILKI